METQLSPKQKDGEVGETSREKQRTFFKEKQG